MNFNGTVAKVGWQLSNGIAGNKSYYIPTVMTDVKWGTLLWFNSPATISSINKPRLVSAAYAAFRPSAELTRKLNDTLKRLSEQGEISPEQCYLLKANPIAQRLLAQKTVNDSEKYVDNTPLEILKELRQKAFDEGCTSRDQEICDLTAKKDFAEAKLAEEKQKNIVLQCQHEYDRCRTEAESLSERQAVVVQIISKNEMIKAEVDNIVIQKCKCVKIAFTIGAVVLACGSVFLGIVFSWLLGAISFIFPIALAVFTMWNNADIKIASLIPRIENSIRKKQYALRRYSESEVADYIQENHDLTKKLIVAKENLEKAENELKHEQYKLTI